MKRMPVFLHWLVLAAVVEWLVSRSLTRMAIFMPKSPPVILVYQGLGYLGQFAAVLASLLALGTLGWLAWRYLRSTESLFLPLAWLCLGALSLFFLFAPPAGWPAVAYHLLLMLAIGASSWQAWAGAQPFATKLAFTFPTSALLLSAGYHLIPALYQALGLPGPPSYTQLLYNAGEALIVASAFALWWVYGRAASWRIWLLAAIPTLAFAAARLAAPAMAGIIAIWSTGLTLYLPWPFYGLGLWLTSVTLVVTLRRGEPAGWAILLLLAGGYAAQLSTQAFMGLIALWLLYPDKVFPSIPRQFAKKDLTCVRISNGELLK